MSKVHIGPLRVILVIVVAFFTAVFITIGRRDAANDLQVRSIYDVLGRRVEIPLQVDSIVCVKASAIRLVSYVGGASMICGVEECELKGNPYTHLYANPDLIGKSCIGPSMGGDAELIVMANPDVIFTTCSSVADAELLQRKTGIPVVALDYGDLGINRDKFNQSLRVIGQVIGCEERADTLINYIENQIDELSNRTLLIDQDEQKRVYVCGISYKGKKGLSSTDPYYPALQFLDTENVAWQIDSKLVSPINGTIVDVEQIALWQPDVIFVDHDGLELVKEDLRRLKMHNPELYMIWPYNNTHSNFEVMLLNSWYMGKVLYPEAFTDMEFDIKRSEILNNFLQQDITDSLLNSWGEYRKIDLYGE